MAPPGSVTILHLSDLRFGRRTLSEQDGVSSLLARLTGDLDEQAVREGLRVDLVVLSGDFTEHGKREEFERALAFLRGLRAHLGLPTRRFVLVPGNHDINWNKSRAYFEDREGDGLPPEEPYFPKLVHYKRFFDEFYDGEASITFTEDEPWTLCEYPDLGVVVAGLDSVLAESHRDEDHHAFLGERQLRAFAAKLRPWKERGCLRIGVMHHDPFDRRGGVEVAQDQQDLRRLLVPELNLLLHGDIHQETCQLLERDVPALGVGSAAVGVDERGPDVSNEYQILVIRPEGVERHLRAWVSDQKRWVVSPRADAQGESGKTFVRADVQAVAALGLQGAARPMDDLPEVVQRYRATMLRRHGAPTMFDLLGVGDSAGTGGLDFLRLFVPQVVIRDVSGPERPRRHAAIPLPGEQEEEPSDEAPGQGRSDDAWRVERKRTVDQIAGQRRLLLIGAPGAGKSALARWLLLELCVPGERLEGLPDDLVPVRVELRRFDEEHRRAGEGYGVFDHVAREQLDVSGPLDADRLRVLAEAGRVLWLFDALDEVVDPARRRAMADRIVGMLDVYRSCRAVVTSRIAGVDVARPVLEGAAFQTYVLQPFTVEQRDRFVDAWHELVFWRDPSLGARRRAHLGEAIGATPSLQELCRSPLLCAMIAYLHREESLPHRRHLLYQRVLERMAEHWDANKGLPARPATETFELEDKLAFLRGLAWRMQSEPRTAGNAIGRGELEDFTARFCEGRWGQSSDVARRQAEALIDQLHQRNGVLAFLGADTFGFAHRALLEYLAAADANERLGGSRWDREELAKIFVAHWRDVSWEETLLLLCGLLQERGEEGAARVVGLLQSIGEGRLAEMYASLDAYLTFCIKALGELPQLEKRTPGDFARALNELILTGARRPRESFFKTSAAAKFPLEVWEADPFALGTPLRRCAGRWPDVERMQARMRAILEDTSRVMDLECWDRVWIPLSDRVRRLGMILAGVAPPPRDARALRGYIVLSLSELVRAGSELGPWTESELASLCGAVDPTSNPEGRFYLYIELVKTPGMRLRETDLPVRSILELLRTADDPDLRQRCAWFLLDERMHVEESLRLLRSDIDTAAAARRHQAAWILSLVGYADEVLPLLEESASEDSSHLRRLVELAEESEEAQRALSRVQIKLATAKAGYFLALVMEVGDRILGVFSEDIFRCLQSIREDRERMRWCRRLASGPACEEIALRVLSWLEPSADDAALLSMVESVRRLERMRDDKRLIRLMVRFLASNDARIRLRAAELCLRHMSERALRHASTARLMELLEETQTEVTRLRAALALGPAVPAAQEVLLRLARDSADDSVRFAAAAAGGDIRALSTLAERSPDEEHRAHAKYALDLYGELRSLLQVGKLRRARVRFDGRDVGVLEERSRVGNGTLFRYLSEYDGPPIAPNMPLGRTYESEHGLIPFFANLLPEGALYEQTARRLGVKRNDRFGVLLRVGADTMGAVEVVPMEPA